MADYELYREQCASWSNLYPAALYSRAAPSLFNFHSDDEGLRLWFLRQVSQGVQAVPPQDVYFFSDVFMHDIALLFDSNGGVIRGSARDHQPIEQLSEISDCSEVEHVEGLSAFIFKAGKDNYGHLLIEMLPKLELLDQHFPVPLQLLVPTIPESLYNILEMINRDIYNNKFTLKRLRTPVVKCEHLVVPGPITRHNDQKSEIINVFIDKLARKYSTSIQPSDVYVSRRHFQNRVWLNENDAEDLFSKKGFKIVHPEKLSFSDQVDLFSSCNTIAGALGAGLTNICFAPAGTKIIMIDNGMFDFFFYDLACLRKQKFAWIFTQPLSFDNVVKLHEDWSADCSLIEPALRLGS